LRIYGGTIEIGQRASPMAGKAAGGNAVPIVRAVGNNALQSATAISAGSTAGKSARKISVKYVKNYQTLRELSARDRVEPARSRTRTEFVIARERVNRSLPR